MKPNSAIFYDGPSLLTGVPILGVLTGLTLKSHNVKTGDMAQAWVLLRDEDPMAALDSGHDDAICGDCTLRGRGRYERACYVTVWQAPMKVYQGLPQAARLAPDVLGHQLRGRHVRVGAYGDPAAIPAATWKAVLAHTAGRIGYTQQWRTCDPAYRDFLMASVVDSVAREEALARGWRTYRVRGPQDPLYDGEVVCPASEEAGHKLTCLTCLLCDGADSQRTANPVIMVHGKAQNYLAFGLPVPARHRTGGRPPDVIPLTPVPAHPPAATRAEPVNTLSLDLPLGDQRLSVRVSFTGGRLTRAHLAAARRFIELTEQDLA